MVCQYNLNSHSAAEINAGLRTHPLVFLDGKLSRNPFHEAATILANEPYLNEPDGSADNLQARLTSLRKGRPANCDRF